VELGRPPLQQLRLPLFNRAWFQVLATGSVLFFFVQAAFRATENPSFLPTLLVLGAFVVPTSFVLYVYEREPVEDLPLPTIAVCFLWGGVVATVTAGVLEYQTLRASSS
jgi:RsiW-degrading membrane proteinase PrsW (M82 family)